MVNFVSNREVFRIAGINFLHEFHTTRIPDFASNYSGVNWEETQVTSHFKFVSINFNALVHCSSELNWILKDNEEYCSGIFAS